jgi:hypothetical protein
MRIPYFHRHLKHGIEKFLSNNFKQKNVFIMMRYRECEQYLKIERVIKNKLSECGLKGHLARDFWYSKDLWDNVRIYMLACDLGIAIFDEIDSRDFNPNISIELGFFEALGKEALLLKDKRMPTLPIDFCGYLYRDFDTYKIKKSISEQLFSWISDLRNKGAI